MDISEIAWGVAIAAPPLKIGWGCLMVQIEPKNFAVARLLFLVTPLAPIAAMAIWAFSEGPSWWQLIGTSCFVGSLISLLVFESLRWLDMHEKHHKAAQGDVR